MADNDLQQRLEHAKTSAAELVNSIKEHIAIESPEDNISANMFTFASALPKIDKMAVKCRRALKGAPGRVLYLDWAMDKLLSVFEDSKVVVWEPISSNKTHYFTGPMWIKSCAFSNSGNFSAFGCLDGTISIYNMNVETPTKVARELVNRRSYVSALKFISDRQILTAFGDGGLTLWDIEAEAEVLTLNDLNGGNNSISLSSDNVCITAGEDGGCTLWDIYEGSRIHTFLGHQGPVNQVEFFANGLAFGSGADDATARLWDVRALRELGRVTNGTNVSGLTFSSSGRYMFTLHKDTNCVVWDALRGETCGELKGHTSRITSLALSRDGCALATGSWDSSIRIWA